MDAAAVAAAARLLAEGLTPPFIAAYCRDETGGLDEQQVEAVRSHVDKQRGLDARKAALARSLEGRRQLTAPLRERIQQADSLDQLDDFYAAFKPPPATPAAEARRRGLEPLADEVQRQLPSAADLDSRAAEFIDPDHGVASVAGALAGAGHILTERYAAEAQLRSGLRRFVRKGARFDCRRVEGAKDKRAEPYKSCFGYAAPIAKTPPHRIHAINRGERAGVLAVSIECDVDACIALACELSVPSGHAHAGFLRSCVERAVRDHLLPTLIADARREATERADTHAAKSVAKNLRGILLGPRLPDRRVLGIEPARQSGAHAAAIDERGAVLEAKQIATAGDAAASGRVELAEMIRAHAIGLIAIGDGKACRSVERLVADLLADELKEHPAEYLIVGEAGARAYAGSPTGREELPAIDQPLRAAVSIARRVQDPLVELVKIDPLVTGVGRVVHHSRSQATSDRVEEAVRSCVAAVGVDLNTAGASLLRYVPGLNALTARRVVEHRAEHGPLASRRALGETPAVTQAAWRQAAPFVRISGGEEPLDATPVHPDHYDAARAVLAAAGVAPEGLLAEGAAERLASVSPERPVGAAGKTLAESVGVGPRQLEQIINALSRAGRDPRDRLPPPATRRAVVRLEGLRPGARLQGVVQHVVEFGAFVDVGLADSGLLHVSRMSTGYVSDPHAIVAVGQSVTVWVDSVDAQRRRVSLSLIDPSVPKAPRPGGQKPGGRRGRVQQAKAGASGGAPAPTPTPPDITAPGASPAPAAQPATGDGAATPTTKQRSKPHSGGRTPPPNQQRQRRGGKRQGARPRPTTPRVYEARAQGPPAPLTPEMEAGKEAMRSFGDLMQLFDKKKEQRGEDDPPAEAAE